MKLCPLSAMFCVGPAGSALFSPLPSLKRSHRCSLAEPREGIKGGDRLDKAHPAEAHTEGEASDWLIRHSPLLASLFTEGWDP